MSTSHFYEAVMLSISEYKYFFRLNYRSIRNNNVKFYKKNILDILKLGNIINVLDSKPLSKVCELWPNSCAQ